MALHRKFLLVCLRKLSRNNFRCRCISLSGHDSIQSEAPRAVGVPMDLAVAFPTCGYVNISFIILVLQILAAGLFDRFGRETQGPN
jgi:hypothetical protein